MAEKPALVNFWRPEVDTVELRVAIVDRTTTDGMKPEAVTQLKAAVAAAQSAGLARVDIIAARGGDHKSHFAGTEWDVVGYNANGSKWNDDQRVLVAEGARRAGATRFGLYEGGNQTLHFGYGPPGFPQNITWGASGLTSGGASRLFASAANRAFAARVSEHLPYLAYDEVADKAVVVPAQRAIALQVAGAKATAKALQKGTYGEEKIIAAALSGNPDILKTAFQDMTKNVIKIAGWGGLDKATTEIQTYFTGVGKNNVATAIQVRDAFAKSPQLWAAVPAVAAPMLKAGFAAIPTNPIETATGVKLRPGAVVTAQGADTASFATINGADIAQIRARILDQRGILRKGDYNTPASGELQKFLNSGGFTDARGRALNVDSDFGPLTKQAVTAYQSSRGLKPDGMVGPRTFSAIVGDVAASQQNSPFAYMFDHGGDSVQSAGGIGSDAVASRQEGNSLQADITAADLMAVPTSAYYQNGSSLGGPPTNAQSIIDASRNTALRLRAQQQQQQAAPTVPVMFLRPPVPVAGQTAEAAAANSTYGTYSGSSYVDNSNAGAPYTPPTTSSNTPTITNGGSSVAPVQSGGTISNSGYTPPGGTSQPTPGQGGIGHN